jgi:hypothetical protein
MYDMSSSDEDRGSTRRLSVEDRGWSSIGRVFIGQTIERSGDVMYGLDRAQEDTEREFLGLASKSRLTVSPDFASKLIATFLVVWPQNHSIGFPRLGLKIGSCGLVIWLTKSPRQFLNLGLKTKWVMIYWLHHKIDRRMKMAWDTRRDLTACFA